MRRQDLRFKTLWAASLTLLVAVCALTFGLIGSTGSAAHAAGASVTVLKTTTPSGDPQSFTINLTGPVSLSGTITDATDYTFTDLPPGTYTLSEVTPVGWVNTNFSCADTGNSQTFTLGVSDAITCEYFNIKLSTLIVQKTTTPSGASQSFPISVTGPFSGSGTISDATDATFTNIPAGTYEITETIAPGWSSTGVDCGGAENEVDNGFAEVDIGPGQTVICEFSNHTVGTFEVGKDFQPDNPAAVEVTVACTSGDSSPPTEVDEAGGPVAFTIVDFSGNPSCTATETGVPPGYITSSCTALLSAGGCTIVNTIAPTVAPATQTPAPTPTPTPGPPTATPGSVGGAVTILADDDSGGGMTWLGLLVLPLAVAMLAGWRRARARVS